jgi:multicomponent Na+:H+ antiporter subunit F
MRPAANGYRDRWCADVIPELVAGAAFTWAALLLLAGGVLLLRASDSLQRLLALDVLGSIVIILLAALSVLRGVSYSIDAALAIALLSFLATLVAARYLMLRRRRSS